MVLIGKYIAFKNTNRFGDFIEEIESVNREGYDFLYVTNESFSDEDKENFFHNMIEIAALCEKDVYAEFPLTHFEDMKKLYYANVKKIVASSKTTLTDEVINDGMTRFGKDLIVKESDFMKIVSSNANVENAGSDSFVIFDTDEKIDVYSVKEALNQKGFETKSLKCEIPWSELKKNSDGLVPVIVVDYKSDKILMMAYMNEEAYVNTFKTGLMNYYSRSRNSQWIKGETSGHFQYVKYIKADCDKDTLLAGVSQIGVACHTGSDTCFFNDVLKSTSAEKNPSKILTDLYKVVEDRKVNPKEGSYTNYLFDKGLDKILKKVGEEACEIVIASKNEEPKEIKYEIADFLYHLSVLMVEKGVTWEEVADELAKR